jgi:AraC family transcriptional activator of pyochelin receptor
VQFNIPTHKEIAEKARSLILADLSIYDSVYSLAEKTRTNPFTLKIAFKKYFGVSVFQFSRQQRIDKAKELLSTTNYTLQTIADMTGYTEGNNFQIAFKTVVGCTPGQFRKKANNHE